MVRKRKKTANKKTNGKKDVKKLTVQQTIAYKEMGRDGICRVQGNVYSKCIRFYDINYQLAQNEDKNAIFENWCDFLNYFDSSIHFQLSFINHKSSMKEFEQVIKISPQGDAYDDIRMEYANMLKKQLARGNNGLVKTKYITFSIEAENIREAKPKLERIESDILNNFKILGVMAYPLNGEERLRILYETFNPDSTVEFQFDYAIIPTVELAEFDFSKLREWEQKILFLIAVHTVEAMEEDHVFMETEVEVRCQDEIFKAKGKVVKQNGWKLFEECFKNEDGLAIENPADAGKDSIPKVEADHKFYNVSAAKTEHFTAPPKPYSEDTLLAAMETAGNKEFEEDTEKKGLGTPATRAGIIEKLIASQYAVRKGKQILPTEDGKVLIDILPDFLKSATMTAEWENQLLEMEQGKMAPGQFMTGIEKLLSMMLNHCDSIPEEETRRFQKKESLGTCPVCGGLVYEGKKNFYCGNRECNFCLWKENKYLQSMEKDMDARMTAELLKNGSVHVKDLYSRKKDLYFEADLHMETDENGRVTFSLSFPKRKTMKKNKRK